MQTIKLQQRGTLTLPKKLREALDLSEGQSLRVEQNGTKIILEAEQNLDRQLMADLQQGLKDIKNGNFIEFSSVDELHKKIGQYEDSSN